MKFLLVLLLWIIVLFLKGWLFWTTLVLVIIISSYVIGYWWHRNSEPWKKIYFPFIDTFSVISCVRLEIAEAANEVFSLRKPLTAILLKIQPNYTEDEIKYLLDKWDKEFISGQNKEIFRSILLEKKVVDEKVDFEVDEMIKRMTSKENYNSYYVRHAIGDIIGFKLGLDQKLKYWKAILFEEVG